MTFGVTVLATPAVDDPLDGSYVLPIRKSRYEDLSELGVYLEELAKVMDVIVVDGSGPDLFAMHKTFWPSALHVAPRTDLQGANGKVAGVLTGVALSSHDKVVIADEDVRYERRSLTRVLALLDDAEVVRPQNYFDPAPWHSYWDTARSLLNRALDGDWPGTLAVRRSVLETTHGYDGDAMFENLELVRTVQAAGGREAVPLDLFVARRPSTFAHFLSQRVRQAYDEFARPGRMALQLMLLPVLVALLRWKPLWLLAGGLASCGVAEYGRRRGGGDRVFPWLASLMAPLWLGERALCSWLAVLSRARYGGVRYRGRIVSKAATPPSVLRARLQRFTGGEAR